jgi:pimeloyl-ACP methyl ester carboxylesterase
VAPDLPADDETATLEDYAAHVIDAVDAVGASGDVAVVGHSFGAFTAPLVADRLSARVLVLLAGMVPAPGESPDEWWQNTGYAAAVTRQAARDDGLTGNPDPLVSFYHDVAPEVAEEAMGRGRAHPSAVAMAAPWPLEAWPAVPTRFLLCRDDRFFPPDFFRHLVPKRLGLAPDEIAGSHCVALSRPTALADRLERYGRHPGMTSRGPHSSKGS